MCEAGKASIAKLPVTNSNNSSNSDIKGSEPSHATLLLLGTIPYPLHQAEDASTNSKGATLYTQRSKTSLQGLWLSKEQSAATDCSSRSGQHKTGWLPWVEGKENLVGMVPSTKYSQWLSLTFKPASKHPHALTTSHPNQNTRVSLSGISKIASKTFHFCRSCTSSLEYRQAGHESKASLSGDNLALRGDGGWHINSVDLLNLWVEPHPDGVVLEDSMCRFDGDS